MDYRLIVLSSAGKPLGAEDWNCTSDIEAIDRASRQIPSYGSELWQGARRISTFAGPLSASPPPPAELAG